MKTTLAVLLLSLLSFDVYVFRISSFSASSFASSGWRTVNTNLPRKVVLHAVSSDILPEPQSDPTLKEHVFKIIHTLLKDQPTGAEAAKDSSVEARIDTKILIDNAHILVQGHVYEDAMEELLNLCKGKEAVNALERLDGLLRSFIQNERKSRCRLKVNYLINGATSNRLDEAITMLSNADEIDENLLRFIDGLIEKRITMLGGPAADREDEKLLSPSGKDAVNVLKMIHKRLSAEIQLSKDYNLRLLSMLIAEKDDDKLDSSLRKSLRTVEKFQIFSSYLEECIDHLSRTIEQQSTFTVEDQSEIKSDNRIEILQRSREILRRVSELSRTLKTGLSDEDDLFSTDADDYIT